MLELRKTLLTSFRPAGPMALSFCCLTHTVRTGAAVGAAWELHCCQGLSEATDSLAKALAVRSSPACAKLKIEDGT